MNAQTSLCSCHRNAPLCRCCSTNLLGTCACWCPDWLGPSKQPILKAKAVQAQSCRAAGACWVATVLWAPARGLAHLVPVQHLMPQRAILLHAAI